MAVVANGTVGGIRHPNSSTYMNANFAKNTGFTYFLRARITDTTHTNSYVVQLGGTDNDSCSILYGFVANSYEFYGSGGTYRTSSQISVNDTNWHTICYRMGAGDRDGVGESTEWAYFLDGNKTVINSNLTDGFQTSNIPDSDNIIDDLGIGQTAIAGSKAKVEVSEVAFWPEALTDNQISMMTNFSVEFVEKTTPATLYFDLDACGTREKYSGNDGAGIYAQGTWIPGPPVFRPTEPITKTYGYFGYAGLALSGSELKDNIPSISGAVLTSGASPLAEITITLSNSDDTWKAAGTGPVGSTADTQAIIDGFTSNQSYTNGWNNEIRDKASTSDITRVSDTVVTFTLQPQAAFSIDAAERVDFTMPEQARDGVGVYDTVSFLIEAAGSPAKPYRGVTRRKPQNQLLTM